MCIYSNTTNVQTYYKTEDEYVDFVWHEYLQGHKICQIIHLKDCVRVVVKLYDRIIFKSS